MRTFVRAFGFCPLKGSCSTLRLELERFPPDIHLSAVVSKLSNRTRNGYSPLHIAIVVMTIGIGLLVAVPPLFVRSEQDKALDAFRYLADVHVAQNEFKEIHGHYASDLDQLDLRRPSPTYFTVGEIQLAVPDTNAPNWSLTLTRRGGGEAFGSYNVTFTKSGFDSAHSDIHAPIYPTAK